MGILTALWVVPLVVFAIMSGVLVLFRRRALAFPAGVARRRYWRSVLVLAGLVAAIRVGICWNLTYRAFTHQESLSEVPLIILLLPEYLLTPGDPSTPEGMWALTGSLVAGSFVWISILALVVWTAVGAARNRTTT